VETVGATVCARSWEIRDKASPFHPADRAEWSDTGIKECGFPARGNPSQYSTSSTTVDERIESLPPVVTNSRVRREAHGHFGGRIMETG
jgi:hypothetical protein